MFLDWLENLFNVTPGDKPVEEPRKVSRENIEPSIDAEDSPKNELPVEDVQYIGGYLITHDPNCYNPYAVYCKTHLQKDLGADGFGFRTREEAQKFVRWMAG